MTRTDPLVLQMAISNILGKFPTYMRPPYSSCTPESGCQQDLADLGYVVSYFNLDTDGEHINFIVYLLHTC